MTSSNTSNNNSTILPLPQSKRISQSELIYTLRGCSSNLRVDGRTCGDFRPYTLSTTSNTHNSASKKSPLLLLSNGSSRISLPGSTTDIIVSIKNEIVSPKPNNPESGVIEYNVDFFSSHGTTTGGSFGVSKKVEMEYSQILKRLLWSQLSDLDLTISPGKYCWRVCVDVMILAFDGGSTVVDAISVGVHAALNSMVLPRVTVVEKEFGGAGEKDEFLVDGEDNARPEGVKDCPVIVTICVLRGSVKGGGGGKRRVMIVDANWEEEECADMKVSVAVDGKGVVCGIYTHGGGGMPFKMLGEVMDMAKKGAKTVFDKVLKIGDDYCEDGGAERRNKDGELLYGHFRVR